MFADLCATFVERMGQMTAGELVAEWEAAAHTLEHAGNTRGAYLYEMEQAATRMRDLQLLIDDSPGALGLALRAKVRRIAQTHDLGMICVDHGGLPAKSGVCHVTTRGGRCPAPDDGAAFRLIESKASSSWWASHPSRRTRPTRRGHLIHRREFGGFSITANPKRTAWNQAPALHNGHYWDAIFGKIVVSGPFPTLSKNCGPNSGNSGAGFRTDVRSSAPPVSGCPTYQSIVRSHTKYPMPYATSVGGLVNMFRWDPCVRVGRA